MGEGTSPSGHHTQVIFLLIPPTGPRGSPDCCGSVVHTEVALHPEHLYPLPVSLWDTPPQCSPLDTILFISVSKHTHPASFSLSHCF